MEKLTELLSSFSDYIVFELLGLDQSGLFATALQYFIATFILIAFLVVIVTYVMGIITSYLPMDKIRDYLERNKKSGLGNILASLLGAITPFCSCSSIPLFVGMMQARIPLGIALSFLITSPLVNEIAIVLFWVSYGWKVTVIYILSGIVLGVIGGIILDKMGMSAHIAEWLKQLHSKTEKTIEDKRSLKQKFPEIHKEAVVETLVDKGVPLGAAIAFMMGSIGLSLPEALLLKKVMQKKLIIAFFSVIGIGMIISGYVFNLIF